MTSLVREQGGSLSVLTIVLLPLVLVVTVGVFELGMARLVAARARIAADLATTVAVNEQDQDELARTGRLRLAADAERVARAHFALGLEGLARSLSLAPDRVAASAQVAVSPTAGLDPRTGVRHEGPTVRLTADVPVRTPAFGAILGRPVTVIRVVSSSSAR